MTTQRDQYRGSIIGPSYLQIIGSSMFAGAIATLVTHPLQLIKTVVQYRTEGKRITNDSMSRFRQSSWRVFQQLRNKKLNKQGLTLFYRGLQINMMNKLSYLAIRNFVYTFAFDSLDSKIEITHGQTVMLAGFAGALAAYFTSPFAMITIRQILDTQLKPEMRRNYNDLQIALKEMKTAKKMFRGCHLNALRHASLNVTIAAPYNFISERMLQGMGYYSRAIAPVALVLASLISSAVTIPFDNMRTRIMQADDRPERNKLNYKNSIDIISKVMKHEGGIKHLWAGFSTYYLGILIYATLTSGITSLMTDALRRKKVLEDWQI